MPSSAPPSDSWFPRPALPRATARHPGVNCPIPGCNFRFAHDEDDTRHKWRGWAFHARNHAHPRWPFQTARPETNERLFWEHHRWWFEGMPVNADRDAVLREPEFRCPIPYCMWAFDTPGRRGGFRHCAADDNHPFFDPFRREPDPRIRYALFKALAAELDAPRTPKQSRPVPRARTSGLRRMFTDADLERLAELMARRGR